MAEVLQTTWETEGATERWTVQSVVPKDWYKSTNNRPLLVSAVGPEQERGEWVLKPLGQLGGPSSIRELVGARFARWLGVPVPDYGLLEVPTTILHGLTSSVASRLRSSEGPHFGSRFVDGFIDLEMPGAVAQDARSTAVDIFSLDVMIDHGDRTRERSNVLIGDGSLMAIDHEYTFCFFGLIGGAGPSWVKDIFFRLSREHFFSERFPHWRTSLDHLRSRLSELDESAIDSLTAGIPDPWRVDSGADCLSEIRAFLSDVADKKDQLFRHLEADGGGGSTDE